MADRGQVVVFEEDLDHFVNKYAQLDALREEEKNAKCAHQQALCKSSEEPMLGPKIALEDVSMALEDLEKHIGGLALPV